MSDPSRWLDPSTHAPSGARELLASAPRVPVLTPEARARMAARLAKVGVAGGAVAAGVWVWKALFGAGVVGLASVVFVGMAHQRGAISRREHAPQVVAIARAVPTGIQAREVIVPAAPVSEALAIQQPVVSASSALSASSPATNARPVGAAHVVTPSVVRDHASDDELELVSRAAGLADRDPSGALVLVRQHVARFPRGEHLQERERVAVRALARAGRAPEARIRGEAFLRRYPESIYATPIRDLLRTLP